MKKWILYGLWGVLYVLCAILSHVAEPTAAQSVAMTVLSVLFFVPPFWLLVDGLRQQQKRTLQVLQWISIGSLLLTMVFLVANVLSVLGSDTLGLVLYEFLIFVSVPMICSRLWGLSLFLWACLLFAVLFTKNKKKA